MEIGKYKLHVVETGTIGLDGGAMFGIVPKPLWEKTNPSDEMNRVTLAGRCLLLESEDRKILVDTGTGENWDDKFKKIYRVEQVESRLDDSLKKLNISPDQITDVILTHLHFDHTGGSVKFENDKIVPAFQNAKYYVQKKHFDWALNPADKDKASFIKDRFEPLAKEGVLTFLDGEEEFGDNIKMMIFNGHTPYQQVPLISDRTKTLLYTGDFLAFSSHVPLPYIMGYDLQPLVTIEEKKKILPKAIEEDWLLYFEHDPYTVAAKIHQTEKGFQVKERFDQI